MSMEELKKKYNAYKSSGEIESVKSADEKKDGSMDNAQDSPEVKKIRQALILMDENRNEEAAKIFKELAEQGNADAQYCFGLCYQDGTGVKKDAAEAVMWWEKAAAQGNADAAFNIGVGYFIGELGLKKNIGKAFKWYLKAAENGSSSGQLSVGICYMQGDGVLANVKKGKEWMLKAEEHADADTNYTLGMGYLWGQSKLEKDETKGAKLLEKSALQGHFEAQARLGVCYTKGTGVKKDRSKAIEWHRKAAQQGFEISLTELGGIIGLAPLSSYYLQFSSCNFWDDIDAVINNADQYIKKAEQGDAQAQYYLGICYANGKGVQKDDAKAFEWMQKAAEQGYAKAQTNLGVLYYQGDGVKQNINKADEWFNKAIKQGDTIARDNAQKMYYFYVYECAGTTDITGDENNAARYIKYLAIAAERGYDDAQFTLGRYYKEGKGVTKNKTKAIYWLRQSAKNHKNLPQININLKELGAKPISSSKLPSDIKNGNEDDAVNWYKKDAKNPVEEDVYIYPNAGTYEGDLLNGKRHGKGKFIYDSGAVYEGDYVNDKKHGKGKYTWESGDVYEGDFVNDEKTGKGKLTLDSGVVFEGEFKNGELHGKGKTTWINGEVEEGIYKKDEYKGKGGLFGGLFGKK